MTDTNMLFPVPSRNGKYRPRITIANHAVTISVDYAAKKWLPMSLFGETVHAKQFSLQNSAVWSPVSVENTPEGIMLTSGPVHGPIHKGSDGQITTMLFSTAWDMEFRDQAYRKLVAALHGTPAKKASPMKAIAGVVAGFLLVMAFIPQKPAGNQAAVASASQSEAEARLAAIAARGVSSLPPAEMKGALQQVMAKAMESSAKVAQENARREGPVKLSKDIMNSATAFQLKQGAPNGKQIVVWSDPLCSHCHDFEAKIIEKLPTDIGVTILPVSFREGSRLYAGYVACGSDLKQKVARWKDLMQDDPKADVNAPCEVGEKQVDANSTLFVRAGLTQTPTVTSTDGQQMFKGDLASLEEVTAWANGLK